MDLKITVSMDKKTIECIDRFSGALLGINGISKIADVATGKGSTAEITESIQASKTDLSELPKVEEEVAPPVVETKEDTVTEPQNWEPQAEPVVSDPKPQPTPETSARTYTRDEISKATAEFARSGNGAREKIQALIKDKYGVTGVMALDESRYGEYAADIREMGGGYLVSHAILSASGAYRWMNCNPSARLEEKMENVTSEYAEEGTLAHELAELKLRSYFIEKGMTKKNYTSEFNKLKKHRLWQSEIDSYTEEYVDHIKAIAMSFDVTPFIEIEKKVSFEPYIPEAFGTADTIIINGDRLYVIDLKYGKGVPVYAENNPQLMLYGLGAYLEYSLFYDIKYVEMHIVQPRLENITVFILEVEKLLDWAENVVKPNAIKSFAGEGEFNPGEHCKFCKVKGSCRARSEKYLELEKVMEKGPLLTNEEKGEALIKGIEIDKWVAELKSEIEFSGVVYTKTMMNDNSGDKFYSCQILLPKSDTATMGRIKIAIEEAKKEGLGKKWGGVLPPNVSVPLYDGDGVKPQAGTEYGPECKGHYVISVKATENYKPNVVDGQLNSIMDQTEIYSGVYARVAINFYPYNFNGKKGLSISFSNVQKLEDGTPLGGTNKKASDVFGAVKIDDLTGEVIV